jgi:cell division protein FtsA
MMVDKTVLAIDIGSTKTISVVAQKNIHGGINILGVGASASEGIKKGSIVDIDKLSQTINKSVSNATSTMPYSIDNVFVSISSIHTKSIPYC